MPLYEYECKKCGHRFEKIQLYSDKMVKKCPECGGQVEQMISAPAVQFKGSGWYVTDSRPTPSESTSATPSTDSKSDGAPKTETKSDSAAATKTAGKSESSAAAGTTSASKS